MAGAKGKHPRDYRVYGQNTVQRSIALDEGMAEQIKIFAAKNKQSFMSTVRDLLEWAIEDHVDAR